MLLAIYILGSPASASVVCCDLLYFVVFFRIRYRLNAIKCAFRTFYHRKTLPLLKHIISKTKAAIYLPINRFSLLKNGTKYSKSQQSTEPEVEHFLYFDCKYFDANVYRNEFHQ